MASLYLNKVIKLEREREKNMKWESKRVKKKSKIEENQSWVNYLTFFCPDFPSSQN